LCDGLYNLTAVAAAAVAAAEKATDSGVGATRDLEADTIYTTNSTLENIARRVCDGAGNIATEAERLVDRAVELSKKTAAPILACITAITASIATIWHF